MSNPNTDFKITCTVNKAYEYHDLSSHEAKKRIQGMASGTAVDREGERMSRSVIDSFQKTIKEGIFLDSGEWSYVPLVSEHRKNGLGEPQWDQILGHLVDAWVDSEWNLWIEAELDPDNPDSELLFKKLTRDPEEGKPFSGGLSIGGVVIDAGMEWDDELQRAVNTYREVGLREVTVTSAPAFPTRYLAALHKSVDWRKMERKEESVPMQINIDTNNDEVVKNEALETDVQEDEVVKTEEIQAEDQDVEETNKEVEVAADQDAVDEQDVEKEQAEGDEDAEAVEKTEEQVEDEVEAPAYVTTDAFETLTSTVNDLASKFTTLTEQFEKSIDRGLLFDPNAEEAEEVEQVEEDEQVVGDVVEAVEGDVDSEEVIEADESETGPVERSLDMDALLDGLTKLNEKISSLDKTFNAKIEELANTEVDKSVVPSRANNDTNKMFEDESESEFMEVIKTKRSYDAINAVFE